MDRKGGARGELYAQRNVGACQGTVQMADGRRHLCHPPSAIRPVGLTQLVLCAAVGPARARPASAASSNDPGSPASAPRRRRRAAGTTTSGTAAWARTAASACRAECWHGFRSQSRIHSGLQPLVRHAQIGRQIRQSAGRPESRPSTWHCWHFSSVNSSRPGAGHARQLGVVVGPERTDRVSRRLEVIDDRVPAAVVETERRHAHVQPRTNRDRPLEERIEPVGLHLGAFGRQRRRRERRIASRRVR